MLEVGKYAHHYIEIWVKSINRLDFHFIVKDISTVESEEFIGKILALFICNIMTCSFPKDTYMSLKRYNLYQTWRILSPNDNISLYSSNKLYMYIAKVNFDNLILGS